MKVVHLLLTGQPGGIEVLTLEIAHHSACENIVYYIFSGGTIADQMLSEDIPVMIAHTPRYLWKKKIDSFVRFCKEEKVDVVINHTEAPVACAHIYAVKRAIPNIKIFAYLHNDVRSVGEGKKGKLLYKPMNKAMHKCCNKVIAISNFVQKVGMQTYNLPESQMQVIYNGVDTQKFTVSEGRNGASTMEMIFVGRLIPDKGVHLLLEAISKMPAEWNIHTTIVGYGVEYEHLIHQASTLKLEDKVCFLGKRQDVDELLHKADYFIHPAICEEGFGITLVEAMACGVPCIAYASGAIPEIIEHGKNGYLAAKGNIDALIACIGKAYADYQTGKYQEMSKAARSKAVEFDIRKMVESLESLY